MTMTPPSAAHTLEELCKRSHMISVEKGWATNEGDPRSFATITALNHSELSEALEDWRNNKGLNEKYYDVEVPGLSAAKPCGIPIELADFIIRIAQHIGTAHTIEEFMLAYNSTNLQGLAIPMTFDIYLADAHLAVSKAYEADRIDLPAMKFHWLATAVRTTFVFCEKSDIDLWAAIDEKEAYNRTRPQRHGNKRV